jgi:hypothetical protein
MIGALSRVYDVPVLEIVQELVTDLEFPDASDLLCHSALVKHSARGGANGPTSARIRELQTRVEQLQAYETIVRQIRPHLTDVVAILGTEGDSTSQHKAGRRGGHRKTG